MSESKHTPGPWMVHPMTNSIVAGYHESEGCTSYQCVCEVEGDPHDRPGGNAIPRIKANAHLIAAAPELLASCQEMLGFINDNLPSAFWEHSLWLSSVRAAVDKAKGQL